MFFLRGRLCCGLLQYLELAECIARMNMKASPRKKVQTWLDTVHAGEFLAHMLLDGDAAGELVVSPTSSIPIVAVRLISTGHRQILLSVLQHPSWSTGLCLSCSQMRVPNDHPQDRCT